MKPRTKFARRQERETQLVDGPVSTVFVDHLLALRRTSQDKLVSVDYVLARKELIVAHLRIPLEVKLRLRIIVRNSLAQNQAETLEDKRCGGSPASMATA